MSNPLDFAANPLWLNAGLFAVAAILVWFSGHRLTIYADAIARHTGIGDAVVGMILLGGVMSLPELSTVVAAVQLKPYLMAFSDMFGTNLFDISLIVVVDVFYAGPPVPEELDQIVILPAVMAIIITLICIAGLIEQAGRQVLRLGFGSWLAALTCFGGATILFVHAIG